MTINTYRDLKVWQKAMDLVIICYELTHRFPKIEQYGLSSQLRRAAVSVPANISEGHGRGYTNSYLNHLSIAYGSLMEVETHLLIAERLQYVNRETLNPAMMLATEVGRMLNGLRKSLRDNN